MASDHAGSRRLANRFIGSCLGCGHSSERPFTLAPEQRLCKRDACEIHKDWPENQHPKLTTIVPDWPTDGISLKDRILNLPSLQSQTPHDIFAHWADHPGDFPVLPPTTSVPQGDGISDGTLPYAVDFLSDHCGLRCGFPVCYRSKRLQTWVDQSNIFVLDLSTYLWSHTLKDPRSWAIINVALELGFRHLSAWTAGNAGLALATLVRVCNHFLGPAERLHVYAIYDPMDRSVDRAVERGLQQSDCRIIHVPSVRKTIFSPTELREKVGDLAVAQTKTWNPSEYWDVTDGWDAVGMLMYRLLAAQVIRDLQPTHIVAPLGTGNLVTGILLGVKDCVQAGIAPTGIEVIGALPHGENIIRQIIRRKEKTPRYAPEGPPGKEPLMPKIACTYTPLAGCIDRFLDDDRLRFVESSPRDQKLALVRLAEAAQGRRILAEPSSLAPFAALPTVADEFLRGTSTERILIVNSGCGIMSANEQRYLDQALGR